MSDDIVARLRTWGGTLGSRGRLIALHNEAADEIARLQADLTEAVDACRYALADSPRWQELAETVVHTHKEASS